MSDSATIGKQILKQIGVKSFSSKNKFPDELTGQIMSCYFGGRTECKIRKTPTKVDFLDFLSMYPTVCTLQNLWRYVISDKIQYDDATQEILKFVDEFTLEKLQDREIWKKLPAIVLVEPDDDVLPIRAKFEGKDVWNIGICYVKSKKLLWYSLADVITSKLKTGKVPKIHLAYKFVPVGIQNGLQSIEFFGARIDPAKDDLFKKLIEYRKLLQKADDPREKIIKIIANAISYGIFVEITQEDEKQAISIDVYGREYFQETKKKSEKSGFMFNPIIAIAITSAARLLLATTEIILANNNSNHAYCDTDSMFVPPEHTREIQEFFQPLNPYNFDEKIFKKERSNVLFYGISSKRYCLYTKDNGIFRIDKDDYSAHGLGHLLDPIKDTMHDQSDWHKTIWFDILDYYYYDVDIGSKYEEKCAMQKISLSTPSLWNRFSKFNKGKPYSEQIKPFNFVLIGFGNIKDSKTGELIKPLAPYQNPAKHAVYGDFIDCNAKTGKIMHGKEYWKNLYKTISEYDRHPESKLDGDIETLNTREVFVSNVIHIGKESNKLEDLGMDSESYVIYENKSGIERKFKELIPMILKLEPKDVKSLGISRQTLWNAKNCIMMNRFKRISEKIKLKLITLIHL